MAEAFRIQYVGSNATATMYIQNGYIYLVDASTTSYQLSNASYDTLTELVAVIDALQYYTCTLLGTGADSSSLLNEISYDYKADIKTQSYVAGYKNYTSPKKVCSLVRRNADKIQQSWLDEADAYIENLTGYVFRSTTITSTDLNISAGDVHTNGNYSYTYNPRDNALIMREYTPVTTLTSLSIDGTTVTASYVIVDGNILTLSNDAETTTWVPGRAKATVTLTYGYASTSKEGILASEYATLHIIQKYFIKELMDAKLSGGKIDHASVVITDDSPNSESMTRAELNKRLDDIEKSLPKKQRYALG